jgi:uncharacterized protein YdhG (YjbR/CyaY superfamily)
MSDTISVREVPTGAQGHSTLGGQGLRRTKKCPQRSEGDGVSKPNTVDAYIANAAPEARPTLEALRNLITSTVPEAEERISYGVPFYKYHGQLGGFAAYKNHVSFGFGALQENERAMLEKKGYKTGKMTLQIRFDQAVPVAAVKRILKAKARMNKAGARR